MSTVIISLLTEMEALECLPHFPSTATSFAFQMEQGGEEAEESGRLVCLPATLLFIFSYATFPSFSNLNKVMVASERTLMSCLLMQPPQFYS